MKLRLAASGENEYGKWKRFDPVMTNADRIRAMTDEELARWLADTANDAVNKGLRVKGFLEVRHTTRQWLDWLRQEAEP